MKIRLLCTVILVLTFASGASAAEDRVLEDWARALDRTDLNWTGAGVRARSMSGAFISIADDASAITWNPAGLIQTLDPQISFSGTFTRPRDTYSLSYESAPGGEYVVDDNKWMIDYASFLAPVKVAGKQFSASIAYQRLTNIARATWLNPGVAVWPTFWWVQEDADWIDIVPTSHEVWSTGSIDVVNLGFGTDVVDKLSFGMSANIYFGNSEEGYDIVAEWDAIEGVGDNAEPRKRRFRGHSLSEISHSGFNLTFGLQYRLEKFKLGMVVKTPFELESEWDPIQNDTVWEYNPDSGKVYVMVPSTTPGWKDDRYAGGKRKQRIDIPLTIGVGASYKVSPSFTISGDVEWRRFGTSERSTLDTIVQKLSGESEEFYTPFPLNYYNAGEGRFGFEYNLETEKGIIPLRGGFRYVQHYLADATALVYPEIDYEGIIDESEYEVPTIYERDYKTSVLSSYWGEEAGDRITGFGFSLGTGIHWERIWLDAMFEYYTDSRDVSGIDGRDIRMEGFMPVGHTKFTGEDKYETIAIVVGFTGYF